MKKILMLGTGGTIACKRSDSGLKPLLTSDEILSYVPETSIFCKADSLQILNIDSTNMQPHHWLSMAKAIEAHYEDYDGFVICHGTDTMAYTASALSYLVQNSGKPIVITGAQRPIDMENTDARTNLSDSLRFASEPKAHGVTIVFDGKAIAGTRGKKERTKSYNAFSSINFPYIATIQDGHVLFYVDDKASCPRQAQFFHEINPHVALMKLIPSMGADVLDYMAAHYDAVIIESFGVGGLPSYDTGDFYKAVKKWIALGKTVVMTTQVTNEGSNMSVYEVGHSIKKELGLLEAYDMTLEATVTKLMWILGQSRDKKEIRELFYRTINRDILWQA
ncbi:asparaginase [Lacrimispora saccharolytica]|uniref:asparaginase n=1 Tax=Lacrimispora saccharolytica (strain ATCC 35040 / DSM 2544 / NRCC 2533 / WM1) TaxID=610130 RepID=D9R3W8_LACSW|nr:asparaginase [Lacrimispora saccharolytica]ADL03081.1 L-asparaginase, type I [[Clostridium] saccharolyticum WM1]QRV18739.1 asparaginase [Lacrimispora saccharolytica]